LKTARYEILTHTSDSVHQALFVQRNVNHSVAKADQPRELLGRKKVTVTVNQSKPSWNAIKYVNGL
jgi:hypothetical protein